MSVQNLSLDMPPPPAKSTRKRWDLDNIPVGASFEFEDVSPEALIGSFGHHLARGKYRIMRLGGSRHRFWRLG